MTFKIGDKLILTNPVKSQGVTWGRDLHLRVVKILDSGGLYLEGEENGVVEKFYHYPPSKNIAERRFDVGDAVVQNRNIAGVTFSRITDYGTNKVFCVNEILRNGQMVNAGGFGFKNSYYFLPATKSKVA